MIIMEVMKYGFYGMFRFEKIMFAQKIGGKFREKSISIFIIHNQYIGIDWMWEENPGSKD